MKPDFLFDFGGVVFQWRPSLLMQATLPQHTQDDASTQHLLGVFFQNYGGAWGAFDRGDLLLDALVPALARQTGLTEAEVQAVVDAIPDHLQPLADTVAWLHELKAAGHRLFFLSNMPAPFADELERRHDFLQLFEGGVFSGRLGLSKPDAAIFHHVLNQFGLTAERTVFLDDFTANIDAARSLGFQAVQFEHRAQAQAELERVGVLGAG
jgi:putative hydrolase of the HAD superfamily